VRRRYRLRSRERFQEVRRKGKSAKHRLAILVYLRNDLPYSRFGFTASRRVGNAVQRNRARRLLRESIRLQLETIEAGWDVVLIARPAIVGKSFQQVDEACKQLLKRARLSSAITAGHLPASEIDQRP
jgi:ribonuclease P protein component